MMSSPLLRRAPRRATRRALRVGLIGATAGALSLITAIPGGTTAGASAAPTGVHAVAETAPSGDLPGWKQIYAYNFTTNVALGSFPSAVSSRFGAYPYPWKDTTGYGTYDPGHTVSINNGVLNEYIHTTNGVHQVAALTPKVPGSTKYGQKYGRYAVRWRSDKMASYKVAWMLWPDSNNQQRDGEIDFPEMNLDSSYLFGFMHRTNSSGGGDQYYTKVPIDMTNWHTTVIEWSPNLVRFLLDGKEIGRTTSRVPSATMHWVLQTETAINTGHAPSSTTKGNVQIDWVAAWAYSPTTR
jgi:hypothetical protein